jgi:hypothetical protein
MRWVLGSGSEWQGVMGGGEKRGEGEGERFVRLSTRRADDFLQSRDDVFAISVLFERCDVRTNAFNEHLTLLLITNIQNLLNDIIGVLIFHHNFEWCDTFRRFLTNFFNEEGAFFGRSELNAFLDNVTRKFVLRELKILTAKLRDDVTFVLRSSMFQDVLDDIVAILILH